MAAGGTAYSDCPYSAVHNVGGQSCLRQLMKSVPHGTDEIFLASDEIHSVDEILPSARLRINFYYSFVSRRGTFTRGQSNRKLAGGIYH